MDDPGQVGDCQEAAVQEAAILEALKNLLSAMADAGPPRLAVGFSGGRDSTVLLHALASLHASRGDFRLRALHVNHGLHPDAGRWQAHCEAVCAALHVPCRALVVSVTPAGRGLEAAAREARYGALSRALEPDERLLVAHHRDDQLETVLLHLLRGSGPDGLAGIPADGPLGPGRLARPFLRLPGAALAAYARQHGLQFLTDPANADEGLDRNYLRRRVIPVLAARWPDPAAGAGRAAELSAEAAALLAERAREDAGHMVIPGEGGRRLRLAPFRQLSPARQRNLLRHLVRQRGWSPPPERRLRAALGPLLEAPADRRPALALGGGEIRRYRDCLYFLDADQCAPPAEPGPPVAWPRPEREPLALGPGRGRLRLAETRGTGLRRELVDQGLAVDFLGGGRLRPVGDPHHRSLKYLFQRAGVVPWMRSGIPRIRAAGRLVAVGDLWFDGNAVAGPGMPGFRLHWEDHGPLY